MTTIPIPKVSACRFNWEPLLAQIWSHRGSRAVLVPIEEDDTERRFRMALRQACWRAGYLACWRFRSVSKKGKVYAWLEKL